MADPVTDPVAEHDARVVLLASLLVRPGRLVSSAEHIEAIWGFPSVLEHRIRAARSEHREGDRLVVRQGDRAPNHPTVAISTTSDLNQFFAALLGGRLLPGHLLDEMKTEGLDGARYGLGLAWWRDTSCGVRVYGNDGDALAYQSWSPSTEDRRRQVTVAFTPDFRGDPDDAVDAFLNKALCG
jgi:hypothetical protein